MNWVVLFVGVAAGLAVAFGRTYTEMLYAREAGQPPSVLFSYRDVIVPFLVLATAANIYALWITVAYGGLATWRLLAVVALVLLAAAQVIQLHVALRPGVRDLELALISCTPYVYLFVLYLAALALNSHTLWLV
ncbi:MAG: hypothetical protein ACK4M3_03545 [Pyrobaculum sp.]